MRYTVTFAIPVITGSRQRIRTSSQYLIQLYQRYQLLYLMKGLFWLCIIYPLDRTLKSTPLKDTVLA